MQKRREQNIYLLCKIKKKSLKTFIAFIKCCTQSNTNRKMTTFELGQTLVHQFLTCFFQFLTSNDSMTVKKANIYGEKTQ